ncbi:hypothetical protein DICSQDRAFT_30141, partial [Dichomitus squalens LYAD-421 SS1]
EASIANPNVSEEAKERAQERLQKLEDTGELRSREAHEDNVAIGHKANLSNPHTSQGAKEHSAQILDEM